MKKQVPFDNVVMLQFVNPPPLYGRATQRYEILATQRYEILVTQSNDGNTLNLGIISRAYKLYQSIQKAFCSWYYADCSCPSKPRYLIDSINPNQLIPLT